VECSLGYAIKFSHMSLGLISKILYTADVIILTSKQFGTVIIPFLTTAKNRISVV